jgi:hypothetical protein
MKRRSGPRIPLDLRGLTGRQDLFRISGATRRDPAVAPWFAHDPAGLRAIALQWFARIKQCGDDVLEVIHDGCPVACVEDAAFAYVNAFTRHVNVGFFHGAALDDPAHLLRGSGKRMRHVKLEPQGTLHAAALQNLISDAYLDIRRRLDAERLARSE